MSPRLKILLPLLLALSLILVLQVGFLIMPTGEKIPLFRGKKLTPVEQAWQLIRSNYVDTVGLSGLEHEPIDSMVSKLDPHTAYLPPRLRSSCRAVITSRVPVIPIG